MVVYMLFNTFLENLSSFPCCLRSKQCPLIPMLQEGKKLKTGDLVGCCVTSLNKSKRKRSKEPETLGYGDLSDKCVCVFLSFIAQSSVILSSSKIISPLYKQYRFT